MEGPSGGGSDSPCRPSHSSIRRNRKESEGHRKEPEGNRKESEGIGRESEGNRSESELALQVLAFAQRHIELAAVGVRAHVRHAEQPATVLWALQPRQLRTGAGVNEGRWANHRGGEERGTESDGIGRNRTESDGIGRNRTGSEGIRRDQKGSEGMHTGRLGARRRGARRAPRP